MEKIDSDLKEFESKERSVRKQLETLQSQSSSMLRFSLQWKELQERLKLTGDQIQTRLEEVKRCEAEKVKLETEVETKAKELRKVEELIDQGKTHLNYLESLIEQKGHEVGECGEKDKDRDRELSVEEDRVEDGGNIIDLVMKKLKEAGFDEVSEVEVAKGVLDNYCGEIESKKRELSVILGEIEEKREELGLQEEQIRVVKSAIEGCDKEMKLKEEKLNLIQKSIEECANVLDGKGEIVREMSEKVEEFRVRRKEMDEWKCKLEAKESELERWAVVLALKEKQVKSRSKELSLTEKRVVESLSEVQMKEKDFDEQKKLIEEGRKHLDIVSNKLQMKEWRLRKQGKDLKLEKQILESNKKSTKEHKQGPKSQEEPNALHSESEITWDGIGLQRFMSGQLQRIDLMGSKMSAVLQSSSDPAKLVLAAMQGFHRSNSNTDSREIEFELEITRRSCILLLEELKSMSAQISPPVKEEAMKLATEWKSKIAETTNNRLEILGFLQLVTTYELTSLYDAKELQSLLALIAPLKQATECQALAISDKPSGISMSPPPVKDKEQESSRARNAVTCPKLQPSANVHARNSPGFVNDQLAWKHSIQNKIFVALEKSSNSNPAKLLLDLMQVSYAGYWTKGHAGFEATAMKSFISLLEIVRRAQPHVGSQLKEDAAQLAVEWKKKLTDAENPLDILGFLLFIATYDILSTFSTAEIAKLFGLISQHTHALELCQTIGFAHKFPDYIQDLVQSKQLVEAVRLICTSKLTDKFPPAPLLRGYVEDSLNRCSKICTTKISLDEKDKVVDGLIADLRSVIQCINKYNLESEYQSAHVEIQIDELKKLKENWRLSAQSLASQVEPQKSKGKKRCCPSTPTPMFQPQQQLGHNGQLTAISAARPPSYPLPTCIPSYPQSHSSSVLKTNFGIPGQFTMPAKSHPFAANIGGPFMPTMKRPCMMAARYPASGSGSGSAPAPAPAQAPPPARAPAPTPVPMHSANFRVPCKFPHPNMMQFRK